MAKTRWKPLWSTSDCTYTTADAGEFALTDRDGGIAESALSMAENTAGAVSRLVEMLHEKGILTTDEVYQVLELYGYEPVEDEA